MPDKLLLPQNKQCWNDLKQQVMRKGWTESTLGEIADYINGFPFKPTDLGEVGTPVIRIKQLLDPLENVDRTEAQVPSRCVLSDGDIVFSWSGTLAVRVWNRGHAFLNQHLFRVVEKPGVLHEWLPLVIDHAIDELLEKSHGTTMKHITKQTLLPHEILLPPLGEQKRIADVVSSVDAYIGALQLQVDSARVARNAVLHELLSAGGDDWTETTLGEVARCAGGTAFPHSFQGGDAGIPFVKVSDMNEIGNERFLVSANNYVSRDAIKKLGARVWPKGTVVFAKVGAALLTEKRRVLNTETIFDNNVMGLVPSERIDSLFLYFFMETIKLGDFVQPGAVPSVNNGIVSGITISLPPYAEQKQVVEIVSSMDEVIQSTEQAVVDAKALRSGLLSDLLSGNHEIPASYDSLLGAA